MLLGPWFTGRSPRPSRRTSSVSQWMVLGSPSSAAIVFIFSALTDSMTRPRQFVADAHPVGRGRHGRLGAHGFLGKMNEFVHTPATSPPGAVTSRRNVTRSNVPMAPPCLRATPVISPRTP